jgi:hypothetical protein
MASNQVRNVTAENFSSLGKSFIALNDGKCYSISLKGWSMHGVQQPPNPRAWGAWRGYFISKNIPIAFMDKQAKWGNPWAVPAEWPHLFDADRTIPDDHEDAEKFLRDHRIEGHKQYGPPPKTYAAKQFDL